MIKGFFRKYWKWRAAARLMLTMISFWLYIFILNCLSFTTTFWTLVNFFLYYFFSNPIPFSVIINMLLKFIYLHIGKVWNVYFVMTTGTCLFIFIFKIWTIISKITDFDINNVFLSTWGPCIRTRKYIWHAALSICTPTIFIIWHWRSILDFYHHSFRLFNWAFVSKIHSSIF